MNDVFVSTQAAHGSNIARKFFVTEIFEVIANLVAQLSQSASKSIVDSVCRYSIAPGRVSMSGRQVDSHVTCQRTITLLDRMNKIFKMHRIHPVNPE